MQQVIAQRETVKPENNLRCQPLYCQEVAKFSLLNRKSAFSQQASLQYLVIQMSYSKENWTKEGYV